MKTMNHGQYQRGLKAKSEESLRFTIRDCQEAISANPSNPNNSYYADEICCAAMELKRRGL